MSGYKPLRTNVDGLVSDQVSAQADGCIFKVIGYLMNC